MSEADMAELEASLQPMSGHCNEMGTASTMTSIAEGLGLALPGSAAVPAVDNRRYAMAEAAGTCAVALATGGPRPSDILSLEAFENATTLLMARGGSTNAVIHLIALAGRVGVPFGLDEIDAIARRTPVLADVRPVGDHLFGDLFLAGGIPAVLGELSPLLNLDALAPRLARPRRSRDQDERDTIALDVASGTLDLEVSQAELDARRREAPPARRHYDRGYGAMFLEHVLQANEGCDFDFLRATGEPAAPLPLGFNQGWVGGW
jgi:dihydroxyacid dehydratase/phosphogluconate dehydratase